MIRRPHAPEFVAPLRLFTTLCLCTLASAATATESAPKQSQIKGLLVVQLGSGEVAGTASQMNSKALAKLKAIVNLAPNHLSARPLCLHGIKTGSKKHSLPGSLTAIDTASNWFGRILRDGSFMKTGHDDVLRDFNSEMKRMRSMLDKRTTPYANTSEELAYYMKTIRGRKILNLQMRRELDAKVRRVDNERTKLLEHKEIRKELMIE